MLLYALDLHNHCHSFTEQKYWEEPWDANRMAGYINEPLHGATSFVFRRLRWSRKTNSDHLVGVVVAWEKHRLSLTATTARRIGIVLSDKLPRHEEAAEQLSEYVEIAKKYVAANIGDNLWKYSADVRLAGIEEGERHAKQAIRQALGL